MLRSRSARDQGRTAAAQSPPDSKGRRRRCAGAERARYAGGAIADHQTQKAGDDSKQFQAGRDVIVVQGVTAAEAADIARAEGMRVGNELTSTAREVADARIGAFIGRLIDLFKEQPSLFQAFADPDFQFSLRDAGRAAASSESEFTEDLLLNLLSSRASEENEDRVRLATDLAIRVAGKISSAVLAGLTADWAVNYLRIEGSLGIQLATQDHSAKQLLGQNLPAGSAWMDDADALGLIRFQRQNLVEKKSLLELFREQVREHLCPGIDVSKSQEQLAAAISMVPALTNLVKQHELKQGFIRFTAASREELLAMLPGDLLIPAPLNQLLEENGFGIEDPAAVEQFETVLAECENLGELAKWWDSLPHAEFTLVGRVVAFANARRYLPIANADSIADLLRLQQ